MKHDDFLTYLYTKSTLSTTTKKIYMEWITRCCQHFGKTHLLDLTPQELDAYRLYLLTDKHFSHASDTIVYNALKHTYTKLLPQFDSEAAQTYQHLFEKAPRQPQRLPRYTDQATMQKFLDALPLTISGYIIKSIYLTSKPFESFGAQWVCSKQYCQVVCARTARQVGIPHGFGLSGVRGASIIHRIQNRKNDLEIVQIKEDSGLSTAQFEKYLQVAGFYATQDKPCV